MDPQREWGTHRVPDDSYGGGINSLGMSIKQYAPDSIASMEHC